MYLSPHHERIESISKAKLKNLVRSMNFSKRKQQDAHFTVEIFALLQKVMHKSLQTSIISATNGILCG